MSRVRVNMSGLLAILVVYGIAAASAYALPVWLVKGNMLKTSETSKAVSRFGKLTLKWEDKSTKTAFEAECKKASGEVTLKGGEPGTDEFKTLTYEECALLKGGAGCKMKAGGVSAEELPGWPTSLEVKGGKTYDAAIGVKFSLILEGCENSGLSKTWVFKNTLTAEAKNSTGKVGLVYPATSTLESEGAPASLSGEGELEEKEKGTLEVYAGCPSETPGYCIEGKELTGVEEETVSSEGGTFNLGATGTETVCEAVKDTGTIKAGGKDTERLEFATCHVTKPANCMVTEPIIFDIKSELIEVAGKLSARWQPKEGVVLGTVNYLNSGGTCAFGGLWQFTGQMTGLVVSEGEAETGELNFTNTSGSELESAGIAFKVKLKDKIKLSGANKGKKWAAKK